MGARSIACPSWPPWYKPEMEPKGLVVKLKRLRAEDADVPAPRYMSDRAAGMDLCAAVSAPVTLPPGGRALVPTGFAIELPHGHEGQVRPRSGLAIKYGVTLLNSPGTVDEDFRGEMQVILVNHGAEPFVVERGARIAQLVVAPVCQARIVEVETLDSTTRGSGGFGSSGT